MPLIAVVKKARISTSKYANGERVTRVQLLPLKVSGLIRLTDDNRHDNRRSRRTVLNTAGDSCQS
jgi:hypothetical protein